VVMIIIMERRKGRLKTMTMTISWCLVLFQTVTQWVLLVKAT
jgi:hypothetical protein